MGAIWWTFLGGATACLLGLELRRVARERAAERDGPHLFVRYAEADPDRPTGFAEITATHPIAPRAADAPPIAPPPMRHGAPHRRRRRKPRVGADHL